jgi:hypothetical protein
MSCSILSNVEEAMLIYDILKTDYNELKALLGELVATESGTLERGRVVEAINGELISHSRAEEVHEFGKRCLCRSRVSRNFDFRAGFIF